MSTTPVVSNHGLRLPVPGEASGFFAVDNGCQGSHNIELINRISGIKAYGAREWVGWAVGAGLRACRDVAPVLQIGLLPCDAPPAMDQQALRLTSDLHGMWASKHDVSARVPDKVRQSWVPVCYVPNLDGIDISRAWVIAHEKIPADMHALATLAREDADPARLRDLALSSWPDKIVVVEKKGDNLPNIGACAHALMAIPAVVQSIHALHDVCFKGWTGSVEGCWWPLRASTEDFSWGKSFGLPVLGSQPASFATWGTKQGNHKLFESAGIPRPLGTEEPMHTQDALLGAIDLFMRQHDVFKLVVKACDSASGMGNATLDFSSLKALLSDELITPAARKEAMLACLRTNATKNFAPGDADHVTFGDYVRNIVEKGGVVLEAFIHAPEGGRTYDASVQFVVLPQGSEKPVDVVAVHKPVVSADGVYGGAQSPSPQYIVERLQEIGQKAGAFLYSQGLSGPMGIDVFVKEGPLGPDGIPVFAELYCVDANLRLPGTFPALRLKTMMEQVLDRKLSSTSTEGYHPPATLTLRDIMTVVESDAFRFDPKTGTGVVLHMVGLVESHNKLGVSCFAPMDHASQAEPFGPAVALETKFKQALTDLAIAKASA